MHKHNKWRRRIIRLLDELLLDLQCQPPSVEQIEIFDKIFAKSDRVDSIFEDLEPVEIAESLYYNERIEIPKTKDRTVYRLKQCNEDIAFATYCFFQDLTYIRMFSARAWREFNLGAVGIQTATYCTNIACAKIKEICVSFTDTYERFRETGTTKSHPNIDSFFRIHCGSGGDFTDVIIPCCEDDSFARNARRRLGFYISTLACSRLTHLLFDAFIANSGQFWGNVQDDRCLVKSLHQLGLLLGMEEFLPTVCRMDYMHLAAVSLFTGANGSLDTDSVFAAQMLWDIQHEIDTQGAGVEDIIVQVGKDLRRLYMDHIDEWLTVTLRLSHGSRTKRMFKQLGHIRDITEDLQNVHSFQAHMESVEKSNSDRCPIPGFHLLRHVPLLAGQLMAHYRFELQDTFMDIANDHGHILIAIHLYNAAKKSGALQSMRWEDMEWFIDRQAHDRMFAGDPPAENSEYASRFCLVHGLDPTNFSLDRKHVCPDWFRKCGHLKSSLPRQLECPSEYIKVFSRLVRGDSFTYLSLGAENRGSAMDEFACDQLSVTSPYGQPTLIGLLIAGKEGYEKDDEALNFNILDFSLRCFLLLTKIRAACLEVAPKDYPVARFAGDDGLKPTFAELLRDLMDVPRHHEPMWPKAVQLLRTYIEAQGGECVNRACARKNFTTLKPHAAKSEVSTSANGDQDSDTAMETPPGSESSSSGGNGQSYDIDDSSRSPHRVESPESSVGSHTLCEV